MNTKSSLRKYFFLRRKKKYFEVTIDYFKPIILLIKKLFKNKLIYLSIYYPSNYEVNTIKLLQLLKDKKKIISLLPVVSKNNNLEFSKWSYLDILKVNKYGMLEPIVNKNNFLPHIMLIPLLAFDSNNHRLGYGKGYYDKFLNKYLKRNKNIVTIGVAFSFQKYNKLPITKNDVELDYILNNGGMTKKWIF